MKKYNFLAFDIGATSGRAVLGTLVGDKFENAGTSPFPECDHGVAWEILLGHIPVI